MTDNIIKHTVYMPAFVHVTAQGVARDIEAMRLHDDTLTAIMVYGMRRWFQDSINAQAHQARKADDDFDAGAAFDARIAQAESGELRAARTASGDPMDHYRIQAARMAIAKNKDGDAWQGYDAIDSSDRKARDEYLMKVFEAHRDLLEPNAVKLKKLDDDKKSLDVAI